MPAILYYLKIDHNGKELFKIGVTTKRVQDRFRARDMEKIEVVKTWSFDRAMDAYEREQGILNTFSDYLEFDFSVLESGGNTEIFSCDVLGLLDA
jgi:hypothetical protein